MFQQQGVLLPEFHDLCVMAVMSKINFVAGLRIALADICGDLRKALERAAMQKTLELNLCIQMASG